MQIPGGKISVLILAVGASVVAAAFTGIVFSSQVEWIRFLDNVHWTVSYGTAAALAWMGVRHASSEQERGPRRMFAIGLSSYTIGQILWDIQVFVGWNPFPGPSDFFYLLLGVFYFCGLFLTLRNARAAQVRAALLDAAALSAAVVAFTLALYLPRRGETALLPLTVMVAYPSIMLSAVSLCLILIPTLRLRPSAGWIVFLISATVNGGLWMQWNSLTLDNGLGDGTLLNAAFSVTALFMGTGAILWRPAFSSNSAYERWSEGFLRFLPLFLVVAVTIAAALASTIPGRNEHVQVTTSIAALAVMIMAVYRQSMLLADRDKLAEARRSLRETETRFQSIFESAYDAILILDENVFLDCNSRAEEIFGRSRDEIIGQSPVAFSPPFQASGRESGGKAREKISLAAAGIPQRFEWIHVRPNGTLFDAEVSLQRVDTGGAPRFLAIVRDMSARKAAETERERLIKELEAKNAELERFTYTVSHDLRSPLVTIQSFAGFIRADVEEKEFEKIPSDLTYIQKAAAKMGALLEELLNLSRIGRQVNPPEQCNFDEVIAEALDIVAGRIALGRVNVIVHPIGLSLNADRPRLVEVFQNLLDNSVKFMSSQPEPRIEIGRVAAAGKDCIFVRDNGEGIDPRFRHKLFGLFEKLRPEVDGSGMGLAIVKRIVEVHGGQIWFESEGKPGAGTTFFLTFPASKETAI